MPKLPCLAGSINTVTCPHCGSRLELDVPLLVFRAQADPSLVFSPASRSEVLPSAEELVEMLRRRLGARWDNKWLADGLLVAPRSVLCSLLQGEKVASLERQPIKPSISQEALSLLAGDWSDFRRAAESHPELLNEYTAGKLGEFLAAVAGKLPRETIQEGVRRCGVIHRCGEIGVEAAFQERRETDEIAGKFFDETLPLEHRIELLRTALSRTDRRYDPDSWGARHDTLGTALLVGEGYEERVEQAIDHFNKALEVRTRESEPLLWAITHQNLARAFPVRTCGDPESNIEEAIRHGELALEVLAQENHVLQVMTLEALARTYLARIRGDRCENLQRAVRCCRRALDVEPDTLLSRKLTDIRTLLSDSYFEAEEDEAAIQQLTEALTEDTVDLTADYLRVANDEQAISYLKKTFDEGEGRQRRQNALRLLNSFLKRTKGDEADDIEQAIKYGKLAETSVDEESSDSLVFAIRIGLGLAYKKRRHGDPWDNLQNAERYFQLALDSPAAINNPKKRAELHQHLASLYFEDHLLEPYDRVEQAIRHAERALNHVTRDEDALGWARISLQLAQ